MKKQTKPVLLASLIQAGFPSPGEDLEGSLIDTNKLLVRNPAATFFMRVAGTSMKDIGIFEGDIAVIDRSCTPKNNDIVVAVLNGAFTLKRLHKPATKNPKLIAENADFADFSLRSGDELEVWGVVTALVRKY